MVGGLRWKVSDHMNTQLVLDALNQALDARGRPSGVIHHSDKGSQYLSIKYGERLKQSGLAASVGFLLLETIEIYCYL